MQPFELSQYDLFRAMLLMFRTGAFLMTVPVFGHTSIPRMVRIWFVLALTVLFLPFAPITVDRLPMTTIGLAVVILGELAVGFLMGFVVVTVFASVQFAGHLIGLQMGLAVANIYDPMSAGEISVIGEFYYLLSILIFLSINGHHYMIEALTRSFDLVPLGAAVFNQGIVGFLGNLTAMVFILGVKLSAPVVITLIIVNVVLGILSRTVPQMNVFIVGFPLSIAVGLAMIAISLPMFRIVIEKVFIGLRGDIGAILNMLR